MNLSAMKGYYYSCSTLPQETCAVSFLITRLTSAGERFRPAPIFKSHLLFACYYLPETSDCNTCQQSIFDFSEVLQNACVNVVEEKGPAVE